MIPESRPVSQAPARQVPGIAALCWTDIDTDALWQHCQNAVGIARLLFHEQRSACLVDTACRTAVEYACRAALVAGGRSFPGSAALALEALSAPGDLVWDALEGEEGAPRLAATERVLAWVSAHMRRTVPGKSWGF
jgi:hypothetical protein